MENFEKDGEFENVAEQAFSKDPKVAFEGSVKLARMCGVPENEILKSKEDIDRLFLGE